MTEVSDAWAASSRYHWRLLVVIASFSSCTLLAGWTTKPATKFLWHLLGCWLPRKLHEHLGLCCCFLDQLPGFCWGIPTSPVGSCWACLLFWSSPKIALDHVRYWNFEWAGRWILSTHREPHPTVDHLWWFCHLVHLPCLEAPGLQGWHYFQWLQSSHPSARSPHLQHLSGVTWTVAMFGWDFAAFWHWPSSQRLSSLAEISSTNSGARSPALGPFVPWVLWPNFPALPASSSGSYWAFEIAMSYNSCSCCRLFTYFKLLLKFITWWRTALYSSCSQQISDLKSDSWTIWEP